MQSGVLKRSFATLRVGPISLPAARKGSVQNPLCKHPCEQNGKLSFKLTYPEYPHTPQGNADFMNMLAREAGIARSLTNPEGYFCTPDRIAI